MKNLIRTTIGGLVLAALASCGAPPTNVPGFRDITKPLSVTTRANNAALHGTWFMREQFPVVNEIDRVFFVTNAPTLSSDVIETREQICRRKRVCDEKVTEWRADRLGPNRWQLVNDAGTESFELWLIWVDSGFRTAAVGTPDGSYGWILDRSVDGGEDRIKAAREVLEFNGYETRRLVEYDRSEG
ncbi:MAG: lipocalin family protein [Pseudomonadota bacterium]